MHNQPLVSAHDSDSYAARRVLLGLRFEEVVAARERERCQSLRSGGSEGLHRARLSTLRALVDYADLIDSLGWPVPRAVHMDIMLRRGLCGHRAGRAGQPGGP